MAGTDPPGFNADLFREKIKFVFDMAAPPEDGLRLAFHFTTAVTVTGPADGDRVPFNPAARPVTLVRPAVTVPCDVQFVSAGDVPTAFGNIVPAKVKVLLLDEDYVKVKDASFVVVNGDKYTRNYEPPSFGLFTVGLHEMVFVAENER